MRLDIESLALRYLVSLGLRFAGYLLRLWAGALVRKLCNAGQPACRRDWGDLDMGWPGDGSGGGSSAARMPPLQSGGGGDFGGGGATGDFSGPADALSAAEAAGGMATGWAARSTLLLWPTKQRWL